MGYRGSLGRGQAAERGAPWRLARGEHTAGGRWWRKQRRDAYRSDFLLHRSDTNVPPLLHRTPKAWNSARNGQPQFGTLFSMRCSFSLTSQSFSTHSRMFDELLTSWCTPLTIS
jgi:hypothetical protein